MKSRSFFPRVSCNQMETKIDFLSTQALRERGKTVYTLSFDQLSWNKFRNLFVDAILVGF